MLACGPERASGQAAAFPGDIDELTAANEALGDPHRGRFPFEDAVAGLPEHGVLRARIHTDEGIIDCRLEPDNAPIAVANFVGLARGRRPFRGEDGSWQAAPYYENLTWHRAVAGQFVQTGRRGRLADGGFLLQDEVSLGDTFARPGVLAMANSGSEHSGSVQFFITTGPARQLEGRHSIMGQCDGEAALRRLERRVLDGETPKLLKIEITRD
jgi:peptidyl-prolyl cis-trans isomerase A (cyclophilin A)